MKKILMIVIIVVALVAGAGGTFVFMRGNKAAASQKPPDPPPQQLALEERTVNLADKHYLKMTLVLEVVGQGNIEKLAEECKPALYDRLIEAASKHTFEELLTSKGKEVLREELIKAFGKALEKDDWKVKHVLFTDFVME